MTLVGNRVVAVAVSEEEVILGSVTAWRVEQSYDWGPDRRGGTETGTRVWMSEATTTLRGSPYVRLPSECSV